MKYRSVEMKREASDGKELKIKTGISKMFAVCMAGEGLRTGI